MENKIDSRN